MAGNGKKTIFTNILRNIEKRNKSVEAAGGGTPGKRIKATAMVKKKKK